MIGGHHILEELASRRHEILSHDLLLGRATPSTTSDTAQEVRQPVEHGMAVVNTTTHVRGLFSAQRKTDMRS